MNKRPATLAASVGLLLVIAGCAGDGARGRAHATEATLSSGVRDTDTARRLTHEASALAATNPEKARELLARALAADLFYGPAHNNLGVLHLKASPPLLYEAAEQFEWARKLMPGHPDPRMNLALTLEMAGHTDEAISTYRTALEVYPGHIHTMQALARIQLATGRADDQVRRLLEEIALRGETDRWRSWARLQGAKSGRPAVSGSPPPQPTGIPQPQDSSDEGPRR